MTTELRTYEIAFERLSPHVDRALTQPEVNVLVWLTESAKRQAPTEATYHLLHRAWVVLSGLPRPERRRALALAKRRRKFGVVAESLLVERMLALQPGVDYEP